MPSTHTTQCLLSNESDQNDLTMSALRLALSCLFKKPRVLRERSLTQPIETIDPLVSKHLWCDQALKYVFVSVCARYCPSLLLLLSLLCFCFFLSVRPSLIMALVLIGFSLIILLPSCLWRSQAVLHCGVKACAKLAFLLCPKNPW